MRVRLKERRSEAREVISFVFDLDGQPFQYQPGQYIFYELDALDFPDERGNRRHRKHDGSQHRIEIGGYCRGKPRNAFHMSCAQLVDLQFPLSGNICGYDQD